MEELGESHELGDGGSVERLISVGDIGAPDAAEATEAIEPAHKRGIDE
jgi:hypothetical protein